MPFDSWVAALAERHLANLTRPELTRAVRALSSCYVERRDKLVSGGPLDSAGKRAAFALFYAPLHYLAVAGIVSELALQSTDSIVDLGCGTGVAGAAAAGVVGPQARVRGLERNAWAIEEAHWNFRQLGIQGRVVRADISRAALNVGSNDLVVAAYVVNELPDAARTDVLTQFVRAREAGARILIVEPIARRGRDWWGAWIKQLRPTGMVEREWRLPAAQPPLIREIARGAGLDVDPVKARTLHTPE